MGKVILTGAIESCGDGVEEVVLRGEKPLPSGHDDNDEGKGSNSLPDWIKKSS